MSAPRTSLPDALDDAPMELPGADHPIEPAPFPGADGGDPPEVYVPSDEPLGVPADPPIDVPRSVPLPM